MTRHLAVLMAMLGLWICACSQRTPIDPAPPSVIANGATSEPREDADSRLNPSSPLIAAVSLSQPPPDASRAFEVCNVRGWIAARGPGIVAGVVRIDHAADAPHYARLTDREPELQSDQAAWLIQFRGDIRMPMSNTIYVDPTCIVVEGGDGGFFGTGGVREVGSDNVKPPPIDSSEPDLVIPAPLP